MRGWSLLAFALLALVVRWASDPSWGCWWRAVVA